MNKKLLTSIIHGNSIVLPMYLLSKYKELKLELNEFIFLMYINTIGNKSSFDPSRYSKELNIDLNEILELVNSLTEKGFIKIDVFKNDKGIMEEVISIDDFYNKIEMNLIGESCDKEEEKKQDSSIYSYIEKQFARTLAPIDHDIILTWFESNFDEDLIKAAVDEAVQNGVSNLKYIDKILYAWSKKGIESVKDLEKSKNKKVSNKKEDEDIDLDIVDWDWLDDE